MMEYALAGVNITQKKSDSDYVLCRIKRKSKSKKHQEEEDVDRQQNNIMDHAPAGVVCAATTSASTIPQNLENMAVNSNYILPCASNSFHPQFHDSMNPGVEQFYNYNIENPQICLDESVSTQVPIGGERGNYYVENNNNPYAALGGESLMSSHNNNPYIALGEEG